MDARSDDGTLQNVAIPTPPQQLIGCPVGLDGRDEGVQLFSELLVQLQYIPAWCAAAAEFEHFVFVAVIMLPEDTGRVAAQMQAGSNRCRG